MSRHSLISFVVFLSSVISLFFCSGCADDLRNRSVFDCGAGDAVISFSIEDVSLTRNGESEDMESVIDHAYLLFYASDASLMVDAPIAAVKAEVNQALPANLTFKMPFLLNANTDYQLLAIANADDYTPSGFNNFGEYLESWCRTSSSDKNPLHLFSQSRISTELNSNLPMKGGVTGDSSFRFTVEDGVYSIPASLSFRRMVARIDVANTVKEGFKVEGVALCNWRDAIPVASFDSQLGNGFGSLQGTLSNENSTFDRDQFIEMPEADESGIQQLCKALYCFPSVSYDSRLGDQVSTALIIKAKYGEDTNSSYYRVNVGMAANQSKIDPNKKYLVTIRSVKGSGAATPEEAYFATESQIVLTVVEGWDLEGNAFAMDDYGNFMVLSKGSLEFEGDAKVNQEVRILTSKDLPWTAEYIFDNDASASAFTVTRLSDTAIAIGSNGVNEEEMPLTGKCRVTATTAQGSTLNVDIALCQAVVEEKPFVPPVIPDEMPFALIPQSYDRVKIDHEKKTIEIDGFDPNCFNSFIDIPFEVYIKDSATSTITISSTLEWPLEGRISKDESKIYSYCVNSFETTGTSAYSVYSQSTKGELSKTKITGNKNYISVSKEDLFYLSLGAMAPDDPAIVRNITLKANDNAVEYQLTVKPRPCIIDDVILKSTLTGDFWLIQDRNVANISNSSYKACVGFDTEGRKHQAYNFSYLFPIRNFAIPNKFKEDNSKSVESQHEMFRGKVYNYNKRNEVVSITRSWLELFDKSVGKTKGSPFFEDDCYDKWMVPDISFMEELKNNIRVSKLRMYLISDITAKYGKSTYPICCYLPYSMTDIGDYSDYDVSNLYFVQTSSSIPDSAVGLYFDMEGPKIYVPTENTSPKISQYYGLIRLVRPLTEEELKAYKENYLGYGNHPTVLTPCHPDTYGSEGWLPY